jgi:hypothetical protein
MDHLYLLWIGGLPYQEEDRSQFRNDSRLLICPALSKRIHSTPAADQTMLISFVPKPDVPALHLPATDSQDLRRLIPGDPGSKKRKVGFSCGT